MSYPRNFLRICSICVAAGAVVLASAAHAATWYIGHAGYAGPEAGDPNFRNYDNVSFDLEDFLNNTIAAGDVVEFVDDSAPYDDDSLYLTTPDNVTIRGKTGKTIVIQSDGATNNNGVGAPRSACATTGTLGLSFANLTFLGRPGDQATFVVFNDTVTFDSCHFDARPGTGYCAAFLTVWNGARADINNSLLESTNGEAIGYWQSAGNPASTINLTGCQINGGTFASAPPVGHSFNTGSITFAGNMTVDRCFFNLGETHIPINFFAYFNGGTRTFTNCVFKVTCSDSLANTNGGAYVFFMSSIFEPIPGVIAQDLNIYNCDFIGSGAQSLAGVRSLWNSALFTLDVQKCIFYNFEKALGSPTPAPNGFAMWCQTATAPNTTVAHNVKKNVTYWYFGVSAAASDVDLDTEGEPNPGTSDPGNALYVDPDNGDYSLFLLSHAADIDTGGSPEYAGSVGPSTDPTDQLPVELAEFNLE